MRWFVGATLALVLAWAWFLASPYFALLDVASAVRHGDIARLSERLNVQALRISFAKQVAGEAVLATVPGFLGTGDRQVVAAALTAAASPLLDAVLKPGGIMRILRSPLGEATSPPETSAAETTPQDTGGSRHVLLGLFEASHWRGFRNIYFELPPGRPAGSRIRLQLRLSRFRWRVIAVELPKDERERLAEKVLGEPGASPP